jgi:hypothetical protein
MFQAGKAAGIGRLASECWVVCDSAVLPHLTHHIHPVIGLFRATLLIPLTLEPRGRQDNPQMEIPSMLPLLSSPFSHFFLPSLLFLKSYVI